MDRVRFGRALGFGARQAVKTLVTAVDAATAESPTKKSAGQVASASQKVQAARPQIQTPAQPRVAAAKMAEAAGKAREASHGVRRGVRQFGQETSRSFVRLSGVLWLEVTGVFFGIFALGAMGAAWRLRENWRLTATNAVEHRSLLGAVAMLALFGYFCVSSFVRAKRRERGR